MAVLGAVVLPQLWCGGGEGGQAGEDDLVKDEEVRYEMNICFPLPN